jgi:hypothetical protein
MLYLFHVIAQLVKNYFRKMLFVAVICVIGYTYYNPISQFAYDRYIDATPYIIQLRATFKTFMNRNQQIPAQSTATREPQITLTREREITVTPTPTYVYTKVISTANIRALPDKSSTQIGIAKIGDQLIVVSQTQEGNWYKVRFDKSMPHSGSINTSDGIGWIHQSLITVPTESVPVENIVVSLPTPVPKSRQYLVIQGTGERDVRDEDGNVNICVSVQIRNRDAQDWTFMLNGIQEPATFTQVAGAQIANAAKCGLEFREYSMNIYDNQGDSVPGGTATITGGYIYIAEWISQ